MQKPELSKPEKVASSRIIHRKKNDKRMKMSEMMHVEIMRLYGCSPTLNGLLNRNNDGLVRV